MAIRAELEDREQECHSSGDWVDLARDALSAPQDLNYATELLQRAELKCQSVHDYLDLAGFVAHECEDPAYAQDLYSHAESVAHTPEERIEVCESLLKRTGDKEQAKQILETALRRSQTTEQLIAVAHCAEHSLGNPHLTRKALSTLTQSLKDMAAFRHLTETIMALGYDNLARAIFQIGSRLCREMDDLIEYAEMHWRLFNDQQGALDLLGDAEADCQSTKEYVNLAGAYRRLFQDKDRVTELMEHAVEYAISPNDQLDLADGYWRHLHNTTAASEVYRTVLPELESTQQLTQIAEHIAAHIGDRTLCRDYLNRASLLADDLEAIINCSRIALHQLNDEVASSQLLDAAATRFEDDSDRRRLIEESLQQGLTEKAKAYLESRLFASDFSAALDSVRIIHEKLQAPELLRQSLETARKSARTPAQFIDVSKKAAECIEDSTFQRELLESAEQLAADPDEFEAVIAEVKARFPFDKPWHERLRLSVLHREANEPVYRAFQEREKQAQTAMALAQLASEAAKQLDDRKLVRKLLTKAESRLMQQPSSIPDTLDLMDSVAMNLGDSDWIERLCDLASQQWQILFELESLLERIRRYLPADIAAQRCATELTRWQKMLEEANRNQSHDYLKLTQAIWGFLGDREWATRMLDRATAHAKSTLERAQVSAIFRQLGDEKSAQHFQSKAVESCKDLPSLRSLVRFMRHEGHPDEQLKSTYTEGGKRFVRPKERLLWTEGILALFADKRWAQEEIASLKAACGRGLDEATYLSSLNHPALGKQ